MISILRQLFKAGSLNLVYFRTGGLEVIWRAEPDGYMLRLHSLVQHCQQLLVELNQVYLAAQSRAKAG